MREITSSAMLFIKHHIFLFLSRIELYLFITLVIIAFSQSETGIEDVLYIVKWALLAFLILIYFFSVQIETKSIYKDNEYFRSGVFRVLIVFVFYNIITLPFSIDIFNSIFKIITTLALMVITLFIIPKYVLLYDKKYSIINTIYSFFALFILLNLIFLILFPGKSFQIFPSPRFKGFTENPNTIGIICFTSAPFFIYKFMTTKRVKKAFNFFLILVITAFVTIAFSRASMLAIAVIFATYFYYYNKFVFKMSIFLGLLFIILLFAFPVLLELVRLADNPFSYRDQLFEIGYNAWQQNIFFGKGFGTATLITGKQFAFVQKGFEQFNVGKHFGNIYFETLVENGVIGLSIFLILLGELIKEILPALKNSTNHDKIINVGALSLVLAVIVQGFFESFLLSTGNSAALVFWILVGITIQSHLIKKRID